MGIKVVADPRKWNSPVVVGVITGQSGKLGTQRYLLPPKVGVQGRQKTEELAYSSPPPPSVTGTHPAAACTMEGQFASNEVCTVDRKQGDQGPSLCLTVRCPAPFSSGAYRQLAAQLLFPRQNIEEFLSEECSTMLR